MQAVMMVAGKSTRTYPLTLTRPKPLLPVLNRPLIYFNLDQLVDLVDEVILIVGYRKEMIAELLGASYRGIRLIYQEQREQLGTGHAVLQAAPHVKGRFIVMNGDDLFAGEDIRKLMDYSYAALAMRVEDPSQYGVFQMDEENRILNLVEKPKQYIGNLTNVGCYVFEPEIFPVLEKLPLSERGEIELTTGILEIARRQPFYVVPLTGYWLPTGFPWDLLKTQYFLFANSFSGKILGSVEKGAHVSGPIFIGKNSRVHSGAQLSGPVHIAENCEIGPLTIIGPYTSIGKGTIIGAGSFIEKSILMNDARVGVHSIIRHSVLGESVEVGEACHLISSYPERASIRSFVKGKWVDTGLRELGASIGDRVQLAARTTVFPGCKIWPAFKTDIGQTVENDLRE